MVFQSLRNAGRVLGWSNGNAWFKRACGHRDELGAGGAAGVAPKTDMQNLSTLVDLSHYFSGVRQLTHVIFSSVHLLFSQRIL